MRRIAPSQLPPACVPLVYQVERNHVSSLHLEGVSVSDSLNHRVRQIFGRFANAYPNLMRGGPTYTYRQVRKDIANWLRHNASAPLDKDGTSKISDFLDEEDGATWCGLCVFACLLAVRAALVASTAACHRRNLAGD